jgi:hypothetical protein
MAYIEIIEPEDATGARAGYYEQISRSHTASLGFPILAPQVYRPHSLIEAYVKLGALQMGGISSEEAYIGQGSVPHLLVKFGVALRASYSLRSPLARSFSNSAKVPGKSIESPTIARSLRAPGAASNRGAAARRFQA